MTTIAGAREVATAAAAHSAGVVHGYACDVSDRAQVAEVAARVLDDAGPVDILINNAGIVNGKPLLELDDDQIEKTFRVNALAPFWVTRAFLPGMLACGAGHVVVIASAAGLMGSPRLADYSASKHAAVGFAESLRLEMRQIAPAVKVTTVCPFYVDTGMFHGVRTRFPRLLPIPKEDAVVDEVIRAIQHDKAQVQLPFMVRTLPAMRLLPVRVFDELAGFFGITGAMDEFTGRSAAPR